MKVGLLDQKDVRSLLREKLDSREWWFLVPDIDRQWAIEEIEETFYTGEAGSDFQIIVSPSFSLAIAKKSRMSARQLYSLVKDDLMLPLTERDLETHDVLFLSSWANADLLMRQMKLLIEEDEQ